MKLSLKTIIITCLFAVNIHAINLPAFKFSENFDKARLSLKSAQDRFNIYKDNLKVKISEKYKSQKDKLSSKIQDNLNNISDRFSNIKNKYNCQKSKEVLDQKVSSFKQFFKDNKKTIIAYSTVILITALYIYKLEKRIAKLQNSEKTKIAGYEDIISEKENIINMLSHELNIALEKSVNLIKAVSKSK